MTLPRLRRRRAKHPPRTVEVGQVWELARNRFNTGDRQPVRIIEVEDGIASLIHATTGSDLRPIECLKLVRGRFGAKLLTNPDGSPAEEYAAPKWREPKEPVRKARVCQPRGLTTRREITLFETRVVQLKARGWSDVLVAKHVKRSVAEVRKAVREVAEIRECLALEARR